MASNTRLHVEAVHRELRRALKKGARASRLVRYSPALIELLVREDSHPELSIYDRAIQAERLIREGIASIGGASADALSAILCLRPGTLGLTLEQRRSIAAELVGVQGDTFRRERHEGLLVWDLAMEVYQAGSWALGRDCERSDSLADPGSSVGSRTE